MTVSELFEPPPGAPQHVKELHDGAQIIKEAVELDKAPLIELLRQTSQDFLGLARSGAMPEVLTSTFQPLSDDITEEKLREVLESLESVTDEEDLLQLVSDLQPELASAVGSLLPPKQRIRAIYHNIFSKLDPEDGHCHISNEDEELLEKFIKQLEMSKKKAAHLKPLENFHKDAIVYALYVDLFNKDFRGLTEKLDYLQDLGVTCLWLLPILSSPMYDAGFDIDDFHSIRRDLGTSEDFKKFLKKAHEKGIRVIFDIALNHTSREHSWFKEAVTQPNSPKHDYYIWSDNKDKYSNARVIFKGLCDSNWESASNGKYYFHRFFPHQPDLNYKNPRVLLSVSRILVYWLLQGVDGFRADAIPFLWKEEGTNCENLPHTHSLLKFFRAVLDYIHPGTVLIAEACQPPLEVVAYFGAVGDECQVAYHFPLMPRIFLSLSTSSCLPIVNTLNTNFTPAILDSCQWFTFLRVHDELTLEMVTPEERELIHGYYCREPEWDFRQGEGVSARLGDLLEQDPQKISLAYSIMLTLLGTPIIFYGDEFGKTNDGEFFNEMYQRTGLLDSRYFARGRIDWDQINQELINPESFHAKVYHLIRNRILVRKQHPCFSRGALKFIYVADKSKRVNHQVLAYLRINGDDVAFVIHNLSSTIVDVIFKFSQFIERTKDKGPIVDMLGQVIKFMASNNPSQPLMRLEPYGHFWIKLDIGDLSY